MNATPPIRCHHAKNIRDKRAAGDRSPQCRHPPLLAAQSVNRQFFIALGKHTESSAEDEAETNGESVHLYFTCQGNMSALLIRKTREVLRHVVRCRFPGMGRDVETDEAFYAGNPYVDGFLRLPQRRKRGADDSEAMPQDVDLQAARHQIDCIPCLLRIVGSARILEL